MGLWEVSLSSAIDAAGKQHPKAKVAVYFADVRKKVTDSEFCEHARRQFIERFGNGKYDASFEDVSSLVPTVLQASHDILTVAAPSADEIRVAFDAHAANCGRRGTIDVESFIELARYLKIQLSLSIFLAAENQAAESLRQLRSDEALRKKGTWQEAIAIAKIKACQRFSQSAVELYFDEVKNRLSDTAYAEHVKGEFFTRVDSNKDGKVSFEEALGLINSTLQCASDLAGAQKPTPEAIREVFDAHDTHEQGFNFMGGDEFLNLMRYLQVQVAEAMLPLSQVVKGT